MKLTCIFILLVFIVFSHKVDATELVSDITAPASFSRAPSPIDTYIEYLRSLPIKSNNKIKLWDGRYLPSSTYNTFAVINLPLLFDEDLEQCADFSMRLWAEYLKSINHLDQLSLYDFYGRKKPFLDANKTFREYLRWHMRYSNSYSIKLGAKDVNSLIDLQVGDMYVQNDSEEGIGHVSVIVDEAENSIGLKVYLVGYSFMPAQEFHIEKAGEGYGIGGWFTADGYQRYAEDSFGGFGKVNVKRYEKHN